MLSEVIWSAIATLILFGGIGAALVWYELHVSARERAQAEHNARIEREGYVRYAEARKAGKLDVLA